MLGHPEIVFPVRLRRVEFVVALRFFLAKPHLPGWYKESGYATSRTQTTKVIRNVSVIAYSLARVVSQEQSSEFLHLVVAQRPTIPLFHRAGQEQHSEFAATLPRFTNPFEPAVVIHCQLMHFLRDFGQAPTELRCSFADDCTYTAKSVFTPTADESTQSLRVKSHQLRPNTMLAIDLAQGKART